MAKLCVFCGEAGQEKAKIAHVLCMELGMVYIDEDLIKDTMLGTLKDRESEVGKKLCSAMADRVVLTLCEENIKVGNSVFLVSSRYENYSDWQAAIKKHSVDLSTADVHFISVISWGTEEQPLSFRYLSTANTDWEGIQDKLRGSKR